MPLTLGNDLTGLVSREVDAAGTRASGLGESLTTGNDRFVGVVDGFLGNSLRDGEIVLGALAKNTAYSINLMTITDEYLKTISSSIQDGLKIIGSAGPLSADKLAVLQKNLNDKASQANLLINTADFDGKALLAGGATDIATQVGLSIADKLTLRVADISAGKLFRIGAANAINDYLGGAIGRTTGLYTTQTALDLAVAQRVNFSVTTAAAGLAAPQLAAAVYNTRTGNASFARIDNGNLTPLLKVQIAAALNVRLGAAITADAGNGAFAAAIAGNAAVQADSIAAAQLAITNAGNAGAGASDTATIANAIETAVTNVANSNAAVGAQIKAVYTALATTGINPGNGIGLSNASLGDLTAALGNAPARAEFQGLLPDGQVANLNTEANRALSQDLFTSALNSIRGLQANVTNQKNNVVGAADALRATTNVTQKAADSYLKTDYVLTAQQYSETIRTMVASITSLQAANKIPEAAQRLIDALAR